MVALAARISNEDSDSNMESVERGTKPIAHYFHTISRLA